MTPAALRSARARLGLTQAELARKIGVCLRTVVYWEQGAVPVSGPAQKAIRLMLEKCDDKQG